MVVKKTFTIEWSFLNQYFNKTHTHIYPSEQLCSFTLVQVERKLVLFPPLFQYIIYSSVFDFSFKCNCQFLHGEWQHRKLKRS